MRLRRNPYALYLLLLPLIPLLWFTGGNFAQRTVYTLIFYLLVPLALGRLLGFTFGEMGIKPPNREGLKWAAILLVSTLPLSIYGATLPEMKEYYPIFDYSTWWDFALKELMIGVIMLSHEAFYRGILLFPLAKKNEWLGILAQDIPYALVHFGKPGIEIPYSFVAGIVFAKLDLKGDSFLPSFLLHWVGAVIFDLLCIFL